MAFPNYYVGSTLTDLQSGMNRDRQLDVAAEEQKRLQMAALMQALQQQRAQQMQQQQFNAELAQRAADRQAQMAYQNQLLGVRQGALREDVAAREAMDKYRYADLRNKLNVARIESRATDPRLEIEQLRQKELADRDLAKRQYDWDQLKSFSDQRLAYYNQLLSDAEKKIGKTDPVGPNFLRDVSGIKEKLWEEEVGKIRSEVGSDPELNIGLVYDPTVKRFILRLPPRPGTVTDVIRQGGAAGQTAPSQPGAQVNPVPIQPATTNAGPTLPGWSPVNQAPPGPPIEGLVSNATGTYRVQLSDGTIGTIPGAALQAAKQRDPGLVVLTPSAQSVVGRAPSWRNLIQSLGQEFIDFPVAR